MVKKFKYLEDVDIFKLKLDAENPRFASSELIKKSGKTISQEDIIKHLLKYSDVVELANRIVEVGELHGSDLITCCKKEGVEGEFIVLEGNRRTCACQLLLNRNLIPVDYIKKIPEIDEELKNNLQSVLITLYPDRESIQDYLSDRHIKGIKLWSALEKNNYYMNLFQKTGDIEEVAKHTTNTKREVRNCIIQYQFFMDVFNSIKEDYSNIEIEKLDYLPLVERFMTILVNDDEEVGLNLNLDEIRLVYSPEKDKMDLYKNILKLVGEAFLIRKDKKACLSNELPKIIGSEISNTADKKLLITEDKRIPGLLGLIKKYKGVEDNSKKDSSIKPYISVKNFSPREVPSAAINLRENITDARNNKNQNIKDVVEIFQINGEYRKKSDHIGTIEVPCELSIEYRYVDAVYGDIVAKRKIIFKNPPENNFKCSLFDLTVPNYRPNYSNTLNLLIEELRKLEPHIEDYKEVFACSIRSIFEISIVAVNQSNKFSQKFKSSELENSVDELVKFFIKQKYATIADGEISKGYKNLDTQLKSTEWTKIVQKAHLGAHRAGEDLSLLDVQDIIQKSNLIRIIANEMINNQNIKES